MTTATSPRAALAARIQSEGPIDLLTAATVFPRGELWKTVSVNSLKRWAIGGRSGVKLETCRVKGELRTSVAAIQRFVERVRAKG